MRKTLLILGSFLIIQSTYSQDIQVRVRQVSYSSVDPDGGGGPATGSVTFKFELRSTTTNVLADGMGLSVVFQSSMLMAAPAIPVVQLGPIINTAVWTQGANTRESIIAPVAYGGRTFDRRMVISFNRAGGIPDATIANTWTEVAQITYYTLGTANPQGGYITPEPGSIVAQNELSSDGGLSTYPYLSPELLTPIPLGSGTLPVLLTKFDAQCLSNKLTSITWSTSQETNNSHFEVERSTNGTDWKLVAKVNATGNSTTSKNYQVTDAQSGAAQYRLKQVDRDGKIAYSATVRTTCEGRNVYVTLYPIPARDVLNLQIGSDKAVKTNLQVFDAKGRMVINMPVSLTNGANNFKIQVQALSAGEYILKGTNPDLEISKRFNVIR